MDIVNRKNIWEQKNMPWIPFYATQDDLTELSAVLRAKGDIALLRLHGDQWKAVLDYGLDADGRYTLWHVPSGPLPFMPINGTGDAVGEIDDPFAGWTGHRVIEGQPVVGNATGIFHLNLRINSHKPESSFGMSSIEWIGDYFAVLGRTAPDVTKKRWTALRRQFTKLGPRVPRGWLDRAPRLEVCALPAAYNELKQGARGDINPV